MRNRGLLFLLVLGAAAGAQQGGYLDPGPNTLALYHLDGPARTRVRDLGPHRLDGLLQGGARVAPSLWGGAVHFDGAPASVLRIDDTGARLVPPASPFSIEAWVRLDQVGGFSPIPVLSRESVPRPPPAPPASAFELCYHPVPGGWCFKFLSSTGLTMRLFKTFPITAGRWYHLAFVWDRQEGRLYCDGQLLTRMGFTSYLGYDPAKPWLVGAGEQGTRLTGAVDELHFSRDALGPGSFRTMQVVYGFGKPGTAFIVPRIRQEGGPPSTSNRTMLLRVERGYPLMPGILYISSKPAWITLNGGLFLLSSERITSLPFLLDAGLSLTPGSAQALVGLPVPGAGLAGGRVYLQALLIDPGSSYAFSLTPGLALAFPY